MPSLKHSLYELSLQEWLTRRQANSNTVDRQTLEKLRQRIVELSTTALYFQTAYQAAVIWSATHASVLHALNSELISPSDVTAILIRFEDSMKRWRWDSAGIEPIRWRIDGEREVQDLLWLVLRSYFDDLVDEDALPKLGHSFFKPDFGIPSLRLIIEAKYASTAGDFKKIEREILQDSVGYLLQSDRYENIIVFIYDASSSVQEHGTTKQALKMAEGILDVVIVSRPSQLPSPQGSAPDGHQNPPPVATRKSPIPV